MLTDRDLVCMAPVDWHGIRNRSQQLMMRFARNNRVLYVNPPVSWLSPLRDRALWEKRSRWKQGPVHIREGLYELDLPMVLPFGNRLPGVNSVNQRILGRVVRQAMVKMGFQDSILWTYLPNSADLIGQIQAKQVYYDCVDEHAAFPGFNPKVVKSLEDRLIRAADGVFASARELYEQRRDRAREIHLVPNGADIEHFERALETSGETPDDIKHIPRPLVGYIGLIHEWVALDWIRQAAESQPEWSFVLVGPLKTDPGSLRRLANVFFLGEKPYEDLPDYLRLFSACVIPFHLNTLTASVNPIKLYEYLAAGKPVVASRLPELEGFSEVVSLVDTPTAFTEALAREMTQDTPEQVMRRRERVREHSWDRRFQEVETILVRQK